jgi:ribosomal protein L37AE/L43A
MYGTIAKCASDMLWGYYKNQQQQQLKQRAKEKECEQRRQQRSKKVDEIIILCKSCNTVFDRDGYNDDKAHDCIARYYYSIERCAVLTTCTTFESSVFALLRLQL